MAVFEIHGQVDLKPFTSNGQPAGDGTVGLADVVVTQEKVDEPKPEHIGWALASALDAVAEDAEPLRFDTSVEAEAALDTYALKLVKLGVKDAHVVEVV